MSNIKLTPEIRAGLASNDEARRIQSARVLAGTTDEGALDVLGVSLRDQAITVQIQSAISLAMSNSKKAQIILLSFLLQEDDQAKNFRAKILGNMIEYVGVLNQESATLKKLKLFAGNPDLMKGLLNLAETDQLSDGLRGRLAILKNANEFRAIWCFIRSGISIRNQWANLLKERSRFVDDSFGEPKSPEPLWRDTRKLTGALSSLFRIPQCEK